MRGRITKIISNLFTVEIDGKIYECRARGLFRKSQISPIVGDFVEIDDKNNYILKIIPRINELKRPVIANVDLAIITTSLKEPDLSLFLLDKMLVNVISNNVKPLICVTKADLLNDEELKNINKIFDYYKNIGFTVVFRDEEEKILKTIENKLVVLTGQTGAGKSTLLNRLDKNLNLETSPISKSLGRGVHTTRHVELFDIGKGKIADTPGFSSLDLSEITNEELKNAFIEFKNYECQFSDCNHFKEIGCKVKDAVKNNKILQSRYDSYLKMLGELK